MGELPAVADIEREDADAPANFRLDLSKGARSAATRDGTQAVTIVPKLTSKNFLRVQCQGIIGSS